MAKEKICGIYCIENLVNHKKYIGLSRDIYKRFTQHKTNLNKNNHINNHLQSAWNKYGESNFIFYIVEKVDENNENLLKAKERYYISLFKTNNNSFGYNKTSGGDGIRDLSKECCEKISSAETLFPVLCFSLDGVFIKEYKNCRYAADEVKGRTENIRNCCNKFYGYKTCYGYIWMYKYDFGINGFDISMYKKGSNEKAIDVYDLYGTFIGTYKNARIVNEELKIPYRNVSQVCRGQKRQSHGYICRFAGDDFEKFSVVRKDGKISA